MTVIDLAAIRQLVEDLSVHDVRHIVGTFEIDMRRLTEALDAAGEAGDLPSWHRTAHRMAGASAAVAAVQLEALARACMASTQLYRDAAHEQCRQVRRLSGETIDALRRFLADADAEMAGAELHAAQFAPGPHPLARA